MLVAMLASLASVFTCAQAIEATQQLRQTLGLSDEVFADKLALGEKVSYATQPSLR